MQVTSAARRLSRVSRAPIASHSVRFLLLDSQLSEAPHQSSSAQQWRNHSSSSRPFWLSSGTIRRSCCSRIANEEYCIGQRLTYMMTPKARFATTVEGTPTEAAKELYDKMVKSVNARTMPPNAWLWSLIEKSANHEDIKLLFDILKTLKIFRLSNLRIHANFNCNLCREIAKACARVGAIDFGKKTLYKHNLYGLSPSIASAHHLLLYAKEHNDVGLMSQIVKLLKKNELPLQPGTADIVFSICNNADDWNLISKYSKKFLKAGVKLRRSTFDTWMEFASRIGDTKTLWNIEELRSKSAKQHTLSSGLSCGKGLLLERKPDEAAGIIQLLNQTLSDSKKQNLLVELQKLVSEWPLQVIKNQKKEDRKALVAALQNDIPVMLSGLLSTDLGVNIHLEDLTKNEELC